MGIEQNVGFNPSAVILSLVSLPLASRRLLPPKVVFGIVGLLVSKRVAPPKSRRIDKWGLQLGQNGNGYLKGIRSALINDSLSDKRRQKYIQYSRNSSMGNAHVGRFRSPPISTPGGTEGQSNQGSELGAYLILLGAAGPQQRVRVMRIAGRRDDAPPHVLLAATHVCALRSLRFLRFLVRICRHNRTRRRPTLD